MSNSGSRRVLCRVPAEPPDPPAHSYLLRELELEYPELSAPVVVTALDRAYIIESALAAGADVTPARVAMLARDRLDLLRARENMPHPATPHRYPLPGRGPRADGAVHDEVPCTYCRHPMPAGSFEYCSGIRRLVRATCPACQRRITMQTSTWSRLRAPAPAPAQVAAMHREATVTHSGSSPLRPPSGAAAPAGPIPGPPEGISASVHGGSRADIPRVEVAHSVGTLVPPVR